MILRNVTYGWQTNNNKVSTKLGRERLNGEIRERYDVGSGGNRTSQLQVRNLQIWAANTLSQLCTFAESETISFYHQPINTQGLTLKYCINNESKSVYFQNLLAAAQWVTPYDTDCPTGPTASDFGSIQSSIICCRLVVLHPLY